MKYLPQSAAAGFVLGIIAQRFSQQTYAMIVPLLALGGLFLLISIFLIISRKLSWFLTLISFFFLGWANTIYHSDTSRPGHLDHVISTNPIEYGVTLEGWIFASPDIRERYTIVPLQVDTIIDDNNQNYTIKRGKIYLKVYPSLKDKYSELAYGQKIRLTGVYIRRADPALNPGAFNMKRFLENQHYYAMTSIREPEQLMILKTGGGNPAMHIAQSIKTNLLLTIKQTVPFPESSFLGGVLLGLRSGLSNEVKDTFRAAGVSHVLAVSGLHVTIITLFFMALFGLIKIPRTTAFILIVVALILFTLITGARPSTVRAAIMNSVTLLFYYFRGFKLDRSFLLGICIAALAILIYNPLILTEAAFLFSFSAVLSLSLLTRPIWELACRYLRGAFRIILFLEILVAIAVWFVDPTFFSTGWAYEIVAAVLLLAGFILDRLTPQILEFRRLPNWISVFAAAQLSIQLGMLPLTAFYFKKISISAAMANFLAIPLIGVIVQLGLFAGILGQIPVIGMYLGLVLNASNWLAIKLFLGSADFFGTVFPYPSVSPPKTTFLIPYYTLLLMVAAKSWIEFQAIPKIRVLLKHIKTPAVRYRFAILGVIVLLWGGNFVAGLLASSSQLEIIFFDPSMWSMGGGNSVFIRTPANYTMLIDGGARYAKIRKKTIPMDIGENVVIPALLHGHCHHLDAVLLSSARHDYAGGLVSVLATRSINVKKFLHAFPSEVFQSDVSEKATLMELNDPALFDRNTSERSSFLAESLADIGSVLTERGIPAVRIKKNYIIHTETVNDNGNTKKLQIQVISPPEQPYRGRYVTGSNSAVVVLSYGDFKFLLTSAIARRAQTALLEEIANISPVTVVQVPSNGATYALKEEFIQAAQPKIAVVSPLMSSYFRRGLDDLLKNYRNVNALTYRTDENGAVQITTDGTSYRIATMTNPNSYEEFDL